MPIMRNPFKKNDENVRPPLAVHGGDKSPSINADKQSDGEEKGPVEYKLSGAS